MRTTLNFALALVLIGMGAASSGQTPLPTSTDPNLPSVAPTEVSAAVSDVETLSPANAILRDFNHSDVKFELATLMDTLRDRRHEGWVLAAYPDPKTGKPLIGAGFSLDLPVREHPQTDPLNPPPVP